jgi:hypothetical protein
VLWTNVLTFHIPHHLFTGDATTSSNSQPCGPTRIKSSVKLDTGGLVSLQKTPRGQDVLLVCKVPIFFFS